ncbi:MAG TPA: LpqB family beta-propeller domain-containing protein [Actinomycetaceae bacterium]|nr:LpqB family beta-propeller domain-containing protein [Actinomycetaceae bacterium]
MTTTQAPPARPRPVDRPASRCRPRSLLRRVLAGLVLLAMLAGCATMPTTGPVMAADPIFPREDRVVLVAYGPQPGATAPQIVQGFLRAVAAGAADDFAVAREYLAGPVAQRWDPLAQVRVYEERDELHLSQTDTGAIRVRVQAGANVDARGRYSTSGPDTTIETDFSLARDHTGEWRIVELEDGVLLSPAAFDAQFASHPLYFLTHDRRMIVPEIRWFPRRNVATQIVRSLLDGPSPWLAGSVTTAFPPSTRLAVDSVVVADGVAQVELSAEVLGIDEAQTALVLAQLYESLRTVPAVRSVEVRAAGTRLPAPETPPNLSPAYITRQAVALGEDEVLAFTGAELQPAPEYLPLPSADVRGLAVPYDDAPGRSVVVLDGDLLMTVPTPEAEATTLYVGSDLVDPSIDRHGWAWTSHRNSDGRLIAVAESGAVAEVTARWLTDAEVLALRISRDGARAVVVWRTEDAVRAEVAGVLRDLDDAPLQLGEPIALDEALTDVLDVAWVDEDTVAVLGAVAPGAERQVHLVGVGGRSSDLPPVPGAQRITAASGDRSLLLTTAEGELYERNGLGWTVAATGVRDPAYPG